MVIKMSQNRFKMVLGIVSGLVAVVGIVLLIVGIVADLQIAVKVCMILAAVLCVILAGEIGYLCLLAGGDDHPNYFLYDTQTKRNVSPQKLTFQMVNGRMNRYLAGFASSEGKIWTERVLDNPYLEMNDEFKPLVAYKLLFDLAEHDKDAGWLCFERATPATVEFLCTSLEMNNDMELAESLRQLKAANPINLKSVRDYLVRNRKYLQSKMLHYVQENIQNF